MMNENTQQVAKHIVDAASYGTIAAAFLGYLPVIAAGLSCVWILIQIWESKTFTTHIKTRFRRKK